MRRGFFLQMFYPVDGVSAIAELFYDGDQWASAWLEDIRVDVVGDARIDRARVIVSFISKPGQEWELDLAEVSAQLNKARDRLLENERGRVPVSDEGLTSAGRALSKVSPTDKSWQPRP
jgi:hypothetical protein